MVKSCCVYKCTNMYYFLSISKGQEAKESLDESYLIGTIWSQMTINVLGSVPLMSYMGGRGYRILMP